MMWTINSYMRLRNLLATVLANIHGKFKELNDAMSFVQQSIVNIFFNEFLMELRFTCSKLHCLF